MARRSRAVTHKDWNAVDKALASKPLAPLSETTANPAVVSAAVARAVSETLAEAEAARVANLLPMPDDATLKAIDRVLLARWLKIDEHREAVADFASRLTSPNGAANFADTLRWRASHVVDTQVDSELASIMLADFQWALGDADVLTVDRVKACDARAISRQAKRATSRILGETPLGSSISDAVAHRAHVATRNWLYWNTRD